MPAALEHHPLASAGLTASEVQAAASPSRLDAGALYEDYFGFVWRNLLRLGVPEDSLEDAAQEVFLVVHRRGESFDQRRSSVQSWLIGIIVRVARNRRRALRRGWFRLTAVRGDEVLHAVPSDAAGPAELVAKQEAARLLSRTLDALDDKKRAIFVLVDIEQLTVPEAADALGVNLNTAYARLRAARVEFPRALKRLREAKPRPDRNGTP
jgi:RNA polymerase sigma-70 factor (ECF subfamily)